MHMISCMSKMSKDRFPKMGLLGPRRIGCHGSNQGLQGEWNEGAVDIQHPELC